MNKETGETSGRKFAVQLLANQKLSNGISKKELIDITVDEKDIQKYQSNVGKDMEINCRIYSKSAISLFAGSFWKFVDLPSTSAVISKTRSLYILVFPYFGTGTDTLVILPISKVGIAFLWSMYI